MNKASDLPRFVDAWRDSAQSILDLNLGTAEWDRPTDLPGWSVGDIVGHLAHLESEAVPPNPEKKQATLGSDVTEPGVDARRGTPAAEVIDEFRRSFEARSAQLEQLPEDPTALVDRSPGGVAWDWQTALRNRAFDLWMHEQDIRRAIGRPGNLGAAGGQVSRDLLAATMPFVVGRKAGAQPGVSVRWQVEGELPLDLTVVVGDDGRARLGSADGEPTVTLLMDSEAFIVLASGRRTAAQVSVEFQGDADLGRRVVDQMALKV